MVPRANDDVWDKIFEGPPQELIDPQPASAEVVPPYFTLSAPDNQPPNKRRDIQGLRALAVVLVILDHIGSWPHGGFIGVDVFFVISGYLITGILIRAATGTQRIGRYFWDFYKRRIRRILPAAITVLLACWIVADLVFRGARVSESHSDIWWAGGFLANIHFAQIGTDYFQSTRSPSLVQHYWSLSVEEQFYVVWPAIIAIVIVVLAKRNRAGIAAAIPVVVIATVASFVYGLFETHSDPTGAYFSTFVRAWELGLGATVAVLLARYPDLASRLGSARAPLALAGFVGIVVSAALIRSNGGFPEVAALLPVAATALVIFAGAGAGAVSDDSPLLAPLTNPISQYLGRISYSLYLWHWPAILVIGALISQTDNPAIYYTVVALATLGLSIFSFHLIEDPIHGGLRNDDTQRTMRQTIGKATLGAVTLLVAAISLYALKPAAAHVNYADVAPPATGQPAPGGSESDQIASVSASLDHAIVAALNSEAFPALKPDLDHLGLSGAMNDWAGCNAQAAILKTCIFGPRDSSKVAVVLGDSMSLSWLPAVRQALVPQGWTVYGLARQQCPAAYVSHTAQGGSAALAAGCDRLHAFYSRAMSLIKPRLVILSSADETMETLRDKASGPYAVDEYQTGMIKTERIVAGAGRTVVTLAPPPDGKSLLDCDTAGAVPDDCVRPISALWQSQVDADSAAARATHTQYINTERWFCATDDYCPSFVGTTPVFYDSAHMTRQYALMIAPDVRAALIKAVASHR